MKNSTSPLCGSGTLETINPSYCMDGVTHLPIVGPLRIKPNREALESKLSEHRAKEVDATGRGHPDTSGRCLYLDAGSAEDGEDIGPRLGAL